MARQFSLGFKKNQEGFPEMRVLDYDARERDWGVRVRQEQLANLLVFRVERW